MRSHARLLVVALTAAAFLAAAVGTASANDLSVSNRDIRVVFNPLILESDVANISCEVTLEGTFHSTTIVKREGTLVGYITRAISELPDCVDDDGFLELNGSVLSETLPWHITYEGFTGTLPDIREVQLLLHGAGFLVLGVPFSTCRYRTDIRGNVTTNASETLLEPDRTQVIPSPGGLCPAGNFRSNNPPVTLLGTSDDIVVSLI